MFQENQDRDNFLIQCNKSSIHVRKQHSHTYIYNMDETHKKLVLLTSVLSSTRITFQPDLYHQGRSSMIGIFPQVDIGSISSICIFNIVERCKVTSSTYGSLKTGIFWVFFNTFNKPIFTDAGRSILLTTAARSSPIEKLAMIHSPFATVVIGHDVVIIV